MSSNDGSRPLALRDVNAPISPSKESHKLPEKVTKEEPKSMDYHRQILQNKLAEDKYVHFNPEKLLKVSL